MTQRTSSTQHASRVPVRAHTPVRALVPFFFPFFFFSSPFPFFLTFRSRNPTVSVCPIGCEKNALIERPPGSPVVYGSVQLASNNTKTRQWFPWTRGAWVPRRSVLGLPEEEGPTDFLLKFYVEQYQAENLRYIGAVCNIPT